MEIHIPPLAPEAIFHIGNFNITNTMVNAWLAILIFLVMGIFIKKNLKMRPGKFQNVCEYYLEALLGYFDQVTGERKKTMKFLPIVGSIFFFVLLSNWLGLLPGTGSITVGHEMLLRPANTDLNLTLVMALVAVIGSHLFAFFSIGVFTHLGKFFQFKNVVKSFKKFKDGIGTGIISVFTALIEFVVGLIEIVSEVAKIISLSLRLFGNILAGEVLISVISALVVVLVPTPFMLLELLVGIIQASVFAILTTVYLTIATSEPHGSEEH